MRQDWLIENDLSLTFDNRGRLWKFRPTHSRHGAQPVDARLTGTAIVITVTVPGLESGDVDLHATDNVLQIRGRADRTIDLACDVALPRKVDLDVLETAYSRRRPRDQRPARGPQGRERHRVHRGGRLTTTA